MKKGQIVSRIYQEPAARSDFAEYMPSDGWVGAYQQRVAYSGLVEYVTTDGWVGIRRVGGEFSEAQIADVRPAEFALTQVRNGTRAAQTWRCRVSGAFGVTGCGGRPDLAIADLRKQMRAAVKAPLLR